MDTAYFTTPIGIATISGDENGVAVISILQTAELSGNIPESLKVPISQINEYFEGKRTGFDFKINPKALVILVPFL